MINYPIDKLQLLTLNVGLANHCGDWNWSKLEKAELALLTTSMPVKSIADSLGYDDYSSMVPACITTMVCWALWHSTLPKFEKCAR